MAMRMRMIPRWLVTSAAMRGAARLAVGFAAFGVLTHVALPGIAFNVVHKANRALPPDDLWLWYDMLSGGGVQRASVAALGFLPYLTARVLLAVTTRIVPAARRLRAMPDGESRLRRWRWRLTAAIGAVNAAGFAARLLDIPGAVTIPAPLFVASTMALLTGASLAAMALVESAHALAMGETRDPAANGAAPAAIGEPSAAETLHVTARTSGRSRAPR